MDNPYEWLRALIDQVPDVLQPLVVALAAAIPYVEGEGAAAFGILAGIHPVVAAVAAAAGNILCVIAVVLLGSRVRGAVVARRTARADTRRTAEELVAAGPLGGPRAGTTTTAADTSQEGTDDGSGDEAGTKPTRRAKGRAKLRRWMLRFGVPGASLLAPLALPTMLTAAFFVASGVRKQWVILWQVVAIVLWTGAVAAAATGALTVLGW